MSTRSPLFCLVDMNNSYVSMERIFSPKLKGRPVCVLSNNDGCIVARSAEVKALGIKMGTPWFQIKDLAREHGIIALSSNYTLYADISDRAMTLLRDFSPAVEQYSIDECFLRCEGMERIWPTLSDMGREIRYRMDKWLKVPVAVGFGNSKTLAKLANFVSKSQETYQGVCDLTAMAPAAVDALFAKIDVAETWGIGRRLSAQLEKMGIRTVQDLRLAPKKAMRQHFGVVVERTCAELNGVSCLDLEEVSPPRKEIVSSRSFGERVTDFRDLEEAASTYMARAFDKLRQQHSVCGAVNVFVETDRFRQDLAQYSAGRTILIPEPSDDLRVLTRAVTWGLKRIYRPGYQYKKVGVILMDLRDRDQQQAVLFTSGASRAGSAELMSALEQVNARYGRDTLKVATAAGPARWAAKFERKTQHFTTDWGQLPVAH